MRNAFAQYALREIISKSYDMWNGAVNIKDELNKRHRCMVRRAFGNERGGEALHVITLVGFKQIAGQVIPHMPNL